MSLNPHSDLASIAAFVHTVEQGSFTAAASRLGLSKSTIAKSVARLEGRLGIRLLNRTTRRIGLTAEGLAYHETCLKVLAELEAAESLLASRRESVTGVLRVSVPVAFGARWAMPMLLDVIEKHPGLQLDFSATDRYVDLVEEGIDLAIRIGDLGDPASLIARRLGGQYSMLCGSPAYFRKHGRPADPQALAQHVCLGETRDGRVLPWDVRNAAGELVRVYVKPRHVISAGDSLLAAVVAGAGLAYLPSWLVNEALRAGTIESVLSSPSVNDRQISLIWPRTRDLVPKVRIAVDELLARFRHSAPWDGPAS